jgi:hypothetical protein
MTVTAYATKQDLFKYALARGSLASMGRLADAVTASTDIFELDEHGYVTDDLITVRAAEGGTLPAPLVEGTTYYVIRLTDATFKVSATAAGAAINLTTDGQSVVVVGNLPFDDILAADTAWINQCIPEAPEAAEDFQTTTGSYPLVLIDTNCQLSAARLMTMTGARSELLDEARAAARETLIEWRAGLPVRGVTGSINKAIKGRTPSGGRWGSDGGGSIP